MKPNLTPMQIIGIVLVINGAIIGGTAQLDVLFGVATVKIIVAVASFGNSILGGVITMFTSQGAQVKNVLAMPGIESVKVNSQANPALAQIAIDPDQAKIEAIPTAEAAVIKTATAI